MFFTIMTLLLVFISAACGSPAGPVSVQGIVMVDGEAPGDFVVTISAGDKSTQAASGGQFALDLLPGNYLLTAEGKGLITEVVSINVPKGRDVMDIKVAMKRESEHTVFFDFSTIANGELPKGVHVHSGNWRVENGQLIGSGGSHSGAQIILSDAEWTDFEYEATLTYVNFDSASRWAAMLYRGQPTGGYPYQLFTVRQGATAQNGAELARRNQNDQWAVALTTALSNDMELGRPYRFKIVVQGTGAKYYIDGELILESKTDVVEEKGTIGFMVDGGTIAVEDVVIRPLP